MKCAMLGCKLVGDEPTLKEMMEKEPWTSMKLFDKVPFPELAALYINEHGFKEMDKICEGCWGK